MPYWMFEIVFWGAILAPIIVPFILFMGIMNFFDKLNAKPKPPARVYTPEEITALKAKSRKELDYETGLSAHHH